MINIFNNIFFFFFQIFLWLGRSTTFDKGMLTLDTLNTVFKKILDTALKLLLMTLGILSSANFISITRICLLSLQIFLWKTIVSLLSHCGFFIVTFGLVLYYYRASPSSGGRYLRNKNWNNDKSLYEVKTFRQSVKI